MTILDSGIFAFGGGFDYSDIFIDNNCNNNLESASNLGNTYSLPDRITFKSD